MAITLSHIAEWLDAYAPDDTIPGLRFGTPEDPVRSVVFIPSLSRRAIAFAASHPEPLLVTAQSQPDPPASVANLDDVRSRSAALLAARRTPLLELPIFHAWLPGGLDDSLAASIGLESVAPLGDPISERLTKLVTFVPPEVLDLVQGAASDAGAGEIGSYRNCAFRISGQGTFLPQEGAKPAIGQVGNLEQVEEVRLEMVVPERSVRRVIRAVKASHPYEEVAYDIVALQNRRACAGRGRIGQLPRPASLEQFLERARNALPISPLRPARISHAPADTIRTVAVASGSDPMGSLSRAARKKAVDVLLIGGVSPLDWLDIDAATVLLDVGIAPSVLPGMRALSERMPQALVESGLTAIVFDD